MSSHTKIFVLRSRELLYTVLLLLVSIMIILVLFSLFMPSKHTPSENDRETSYIPGVYSTAFQLGNANLELQVTVDANHINDIRFVNLDETVTTMYPLMEPCLQELTVKVLEAQSVENISYSTESKYTSLLLLNTISQTLDKAAVSTGQPAAEMQ